MSADTSSYFERTLISDEDRPNASWIKFFEEGDAVTLTVIDKGMVPDYEYIRPTPEVPNPPKVQKRWPNGELKEYLRVGGTLTAPSRVSEAGKKAGVSAEAGTEVNLAVKGKLITRAIGQAIAAKGKKDLDPGDKLWVKFTGWSGEAKMYEASFEPGTPPAADTSAVFSSSAASVLGDSAGAGEAPPFATAFHRPKSYLSDPGDRVEAV